MDPALSVSLHEGIRSLYQENVLTDVIIRIDDQTFPCHRLVLSAVSPYFRSMFTGDFKDKDMEEVVLQSVKPETFKCILQYIYFLEENVLNETNVQDIFITASMFLMQHIQNICEKFMSERIGAGNVINVWRFAKTLPCKTLAEVAKDFILCEFESITKEDDFLFLDSDQVIEIIRDQSLNVASEEIVGDAVFRWLSADEDSRKCNLYEVLQHVRLPLTKPGYVFSLSKSYPFLYKDLELIKLLDETKLFHCQGSPSNYYASSKRFVNRNSHDNVNALICISGKKVDAYSFQDKKWLTLPSLSIDPGSFWASCTHNNDIYVSGGDSNTTGSLFRYSAGNKIWTPLSDIGNIRYRHALVADAESVYLLGGSLCDGNIKSFSTDITEYNKKKDVYKNIGHLVTAIRSFNAVIMEQKIYTFGGKMNDPDDGSRLIQCFDLYSNQASKMEIELPLDATFTASIIIDDSVYLMESRGHLMKWANGIATELHPHLEKKPPESKRVGVSMCYFDGQLYVQTGYDSIRIIDISSGKEMAFSSCQSRDIRAPTIAGSLNLPKSYFR